MDVELDVEIDPAKAVQINKINVDCHVVNNMSLNNQLFRIRKYILRRSMNDNY